MNRMTINSAFWWSIRLLLNKGGKRNVNMPSRIRSVLVMRNGFLGDVLQTTPVLQILHDNYGKCKIVYWVSRSAAPALANNPDVSEILNPETFGRLSLFNPISIVKAAMALRRRRFDLAVCLGSDPMYGFLAWLGGVPYRIGLIADERKAAFLHNYLVVSGADIRSSQQCYVDLIRLINLECRPGKNRIVFRWSSQDGAHADTLVAGVREYIAIFPGGGMNRYRPWANRRWPVGKWIELTRHLLAGYPDCNVLLLGNKSEESVVTEICTEVNNKRLMNLVNKTSFSQLGPILKKSRLLISNDSAPVFVAAAVDCPVIVLYGPEWPERTRPLGTSLWHPVYIKMACREYCASFPENAPECKNECMNALSVDTVRSTIRNVLGHKHEV